MINLPKEQTLGEKLQKTIEKENKRRRENHNAYAQECKRQGVEVGQPISLMDMIKKK